MDYRKEFEYQMLLEKHQLLDSKHQHLNRYLQGYVAYVENGEFAVCPYSSDSTAEYSWIAGRDGAHRSLRKSGTL